MKRSDRNERYQKNERWIQIVGYSILGGILLGLFLHNHAKPVVFIREVEATSTPQIVLIETKIDWTPERIEQEIRNTFPEAPNTAVAIAKAESGLISHAYNPEAHRGCSGSVGIMQIACVHNKSDKEALYDIQYNLKVARRIYDAEGWKPWGAYTNGSYKKYLE